MCGLQGLTQNVLFSKMLQYTKQVEENKNTFLYEIILSSKPNLI